MKEVIDQYAVLILATLISISLMASICCMHLWNGMTFPQLIGAYLESQTQIIQLEDNNEAYQIYMSCSKPSIEIKETKLFTNQDIALESFVEAKDFEGKNIKPSLVEIKYLNNPESDCVNVNENNLMFFQSGIYELTLYAEDVECRNNTVVVKVPVQQQLGGVVP